MDGWLTQVQRVVGVTVGARLSEPKLGVVLCVPCDGEEVRSLHLQEEALLLLIQARPAQSYAQQTEYST